MDFSNDSDFEIFDEATSKKIQKEHEQDMSDAANAIGARRMGLITGDSENSTTPSTKPSAAGTGFMGKLSSATSFFSRKKTPAPASAAAAPAPSVPVASAPPTPASNGAQSPRSPLPPPPSAVAEEQKIEAPRPKEAPGRPPQEPASGRPAAAAVISPEAPDVEKEKEKEQEPLALPVPAAATPGTQRPAGTETAEPTATTHSHSKEKVEVDAKADHAGSTSTSMPAEPEPEPESAKAAESESASASTVAPDTAAPAATMPPELKVVTFEVREPSLGAAVVGHVAILEGSCYVWAATEGSSAQGSLAAAVGTRFDGGMPTATPLLAGEGAGEAGAAGGVSLSMAQRLCRRTGRVVFVSCDLSEDSQILVAAVEAKVVALLKADEG
eukprot:g11251.t1